MEAKPRITLPRKPELPPRDALAKPLTTMVQLGEHIRLLRTGLNIRQAELATRAGVSRQWLVRPEQGKPTCEAAKVLRTLETLGFEIVVTPTTRRRPGCCAPATPRRRRPTPSGACGRRGGTRPGFGRGSWRGPATSCGGRWIWSEAAANPHTTALTLQSRRLCLFLYDARSLRVETKHMTFFDVRGRSP